MYDRLKRDFQDGKIFNNFPFIPSEWQKEFDLRVILREDPIRVAPDEAIFLTNIQQLEKRKSKGKETEEFVDKVCELPYNI
jgi:type III restriction enzyme